MVFGLQACLALREVCKPVEFPCLSLVACVISLAKSEKRSHIVIMHSKLLFKASFGCHFLIHVEVNMSTIEEEEEHSTGIQTSTTGPNLKPLFFLLALNYSLTHSGDAKHAVVFYCLSVRVCAQ